MSRQVEEEQREEEEDVGREREGIVRVCVSILEGECCISCKSIARQQSRINVTDYIHSLDYTSLAADAQCA